MNDAYQEIIYKQNKALENLPPTQDALIQHVKHSIFQGTIWAIVNSSSFDAFSRGMGLAINRWAVETITDNNLRSCKALSRTY